MKNLVLLVLSILIKSSVMSQQNDSINLQSIEGKWYIHFSNFPMWTKGNKTHPTFNYTIEKRNQKLGLKDEVIYHKNNKEKCIVGFDNIVDVSNKKYVWRGKGLLKIFKSKWEILYFNTSQNWMVIKFEKTLFTPKGFDIISKEKLINENTKMEMLLKLKELGINEELKLINQE